MSEYPFSVLIDLTQFDQETQRLHQDHRVLEDEIAELTRKKKQLALALDDTKQAVVALKKEVDANELMVKELDQMEAEKKKRLDVVSSTREYKSVQSELASINCKQRAVEDHLIELWNKYESLQKRYETQQQENVQQMCDLDKAIDEKKRFMAEAIVTIEGREKDRLAKEKGIPEEWLEKYAAMRMQVTNPVVPIVGDSCSACFYLVPKQDLAMLKANRLMQCRSCYRLLYLKELEVKATKEERN